MNIRYFEYLREINKCKSFKKAEKRLHISAQQLGRIVTSIEDEFGVSIFERNNLGLHLTKEGEEFLTRVKALLDLYQAMHRMPDDSKNISLSGPLNICASINTWPMMGELVAAFANRYPGISINYRMCTDRELLDNVERYENTVGILFRVVVKGMAVLEVPETVQTDFIQKNKMAIYCGKSNPLCLQYKKVSLHHVKDIPLIVYAPNEDDEIRTYKIYELLCGNQPVVKYSTNDASLFHKILQEDEEVIYIGAAYSKEIRTDYCAMIELLDDVFQEIRLVQSPKTMESLTAKAFIEHINDYIL